MDALGGRKQTTRGIWLAPAASSSGRGTSTLSLSPPPALPLLVLDLEGSDGRERGEDDAAFERRAALFALAVADAVVVNMWAKDVGREAGAGKPLLKTILHVNLKLFANGIEGGSSSSASPSASASAAAAASASAKSRRQKTTLLFVFRDRTRTPLQLLSATWQADLEALWASLTKPPALRDSSLSDFFDVRYAALSNFEERESEFCAEACALASLFAVSSSSSSASSHPADSSLPPASEFVDSERPMLGSIGSIGGGGTSAGGAPFPGRLPGEAWVLSARKAWEAICSAKDLDLPAHRVMVASIRCGELAAESLEALRASEAFAELMRDAERAAAAPPKKDDEGGTSPSPSPPLPPQVPIPDFACRASSLLEHCLRSYDAEAAYYEEGTRASRREGLAGAAAALLASAHEAHASALVAAALARFRARLASSLSSSSSSSSSNATFVERAAAAKSQAIAEFAEGAEEADSVPGTGWSSAKFASSLSAACDAHARRERAAAVDEAESAACASLRDALARPAAALFDAVPPPAHSLWRRARSLLARAAAAAADRAEAAVVESYGLSEDDAAALRSRIHAFGARVVASKAREAAASALPRAKQRFSEVFSRDESGLPRHWAGVCGGGGGGGTAAGASSSSSSSSPSARSVAEDIRHAAVGARRAAASLLASLAVLRLDEDDWGSGSGEGTANTSDGDGGGDEIERAVLSYAAGDDGAALASAAAAAAASKSVPQTSSQPSFDLDAASSWPAPATEEGTLLSPSELRAHWRAVVADSAVAVAAALAAADAAAQAGAARRAGGTPLWSIVAMAILGANEAAGLLRSPLKLIVVLSLLLFVRTVYNELDVDGELTSRGLLPAAIAIAAKLWPTTKRVAARTLDAVLGALAGAGGAQVAEHDHQRRRRRDDGDERAAPAPVTFARDSSSFSEGGGGSMRQRRPAGAVEMTTAGGGAASNGH